MAGLIFTRAVLLYASPKPARICLCDEQPAGGFLGIGDDHYPLPWQLLKYDTNLGG
jgi:hypothetical protein